MTARPGLPLCVDCDGTLIRTNLLHEATLLLVKQSSANLLRLPFWIVRGKAYLKQQVDTRVTIDVTTLPYEPRVLELLGAARAEGRSTLLATDATTRQGEAIAAHVGLFDGVVGSTAELDMSGARKAASLVDRFGERGFEYVGAAATDLPVWSVSAGAIVVTNSTALIRSVSSVTSVRRVLDVPPRRPAAFLKAIRVHQWLKNLLVFVPLLAAHRFEARTIVQALLAFAAFSLCASAVYVLNDLLDLPSDRVHARKRKRPFASGAIPIMHGVLMLPCLLAAAVALAWQLPPVFGLTLAIYALSTCLYSFWLKHQVVVDVMILATLYTSRVIAGAAATSIVPSFWLLAFSMFFFLSLAIVKRYSEMRVVLQQNKQQAAGRGYVVTDLPVLVSLGTAAGYIAILILALYLSSPDVARMYRRHWALWSVLPPLLYWISRVWMKAHRGEMHDDPVVFAATDRQSLLIGLLIAAEVIVAVVAI